VDPAKRPCCRHFDESGITGVFMDPEQGGFIEGPKNLALALVAFELAWVDAGAATGSLAGLPGALAHPRARHARAARYYMSRCAPAAARRRPQALARRLLPHRADPLRGRRNRHSGRQGRVAEWKPGEEPMLQVEKRGRFITNMGFANFVTAAVDSDDPRIKGTCMVILEETDPGTLRPRHAHAQAGAPAFLHQRSHLQPARPGQPHRGRLHRQGRRDRPALQPRRRSSKPSSAARASRWHHDLGQAALRGRAGDPLSARNRFRGGASPRPESPRYDLGLQLEGRRAVHRLVDVWATGEASAALGFEAARVFDELDPLEKQKDELRRTRHHRRRGAEEPCASSKRTPSNSWPAAARAGPMKSIR
jgi:hypothetical protein